MPEGDEEASAPAGEAGEAREMSGVNPKGMDETLELLDKLSVLADAMEAKLDAFSVEEVRLRHEEDRAALQVQDEWSVPWNSISHALLWLAVLLLIAREFMT